MKYGLFFGIVRFFCPYYNMGDKMKLKRAVFFLIILFVVLRTASIKESIPVFKNSDGIKLPVLMYHSVSDKVSKTGKYVITPKSFENDIKYLKDHGYNTVSAKQLIKYVYLGEDLPENPVVLTFDDGMYNNMEYVLPILEKYDYCAVFSIVGSYTDEYTENNIVNPDYSYLRWSDICTISENPRIEFGNHSYAFHSISKNRYGTKKNKNESLLDYINAFYQDTEKLQSEFLSNCNFKPVIYTYPFGSYSKESLRVLKKMGFLVTFSCFEGVNTITHDADCLFMLKRYNRDGRISTSQFFSKLKL